MLHVALPLQTSQFSYRSLKPFSTKTLKWWPTDQALFFLYFSGERGQA